MIARERQQNAVMGPDPKSPHHRVLSLRIHVSEGHAGCHGSKLGQLLVSHSPGTVAGNGVENLVDHDRRETVNVLSNGDDAGVDSALSSRQAECVDLV